MKQQYQEKHNNTNDTAMPERKFEYDKKGEEQQKKMHEDHEAMMANRTKNKTEGGENLQ